ncbi:MAG: leucine-rich repeat protein [Treponemataceae bacterium]|nr:leucine-rich repeat protein [Treponemataceae bacterium]
MKRMLLVWGCIFALGFLSCGSDDNDDDSISILVNGAETVSAVEAGQSVLLRLSNGVSAVWSVSDTSVATLSAATGVSVHLAAQAAGSVTVTAMAGGRHYIRALQITAQSSDPNGGTANAPNVTFINLSAYKVVVCRDGLSAELATVAPGATKSVYVAPGTTEITFHFRYSYCVLDDADSGMVWLDVSDSTAYTYPVDSADIAQGAVQVRIPAPKNPQFNAAYLKVANQSDAPISLYNGNTQQKVYGQEKYYIQPGHSGVYAIPPDAPFNGFRLGATPTSATAVAPFYAVSGTLYVCVFFIDSSLTDVSEKVRLGEMWAENIKDSYTVRHFKQNTDRTGYTLTGTESLTGTRGAMTSATAMSYIGFTAKVFEQKPISAGDTSVINIYYDRNKYTVTFYANDGTDNARSQIFYYGITQTLENIMFSNPGYTFLGWATSKMDIPAYNNTAKFLIDEQNPTDITLYAVWLRGIIVTANTIENMDLSDITDEYTIKVTGNISQNTLQTLAAKIETAKAAINLDLSETLGITEIVGSGYDLLSSSSVFEKCTYLKTLILPNSLKTIGAYAFSNCKFVSITIPNSVTTIGVGAFAYCSNITSIKIGTSVTTIDADAFRYCTYLTSVTIPKSVVTIGKYAFLYLDSLSAMTFIDTTSKWTCIGEYSTKQGITVSNAAQNALNLKKEYTSYIWNKTTK